MEPEHNMEAPEHLLNDMELDPAVNFFSISLQRIAKLTSSLFSFLLLYYLLARISK